MWRYYKYACICVYTICTQTSHTHTPSHTDNHTLRERPVQARATVCRPTRMRIAADAMLVLAVGRVSRTLAALDRGR